MDSLARNHISVVHYCLLQVVVGDVRDDFYCVQCEVHRPPSCHHCSRCQECVMLMDHHWCVMDVDGLVFKSANATIDVLA